MVISNPLSWGLLNKVHLIGCGHSTCSELKKYEFYPVSHGGTAQMINLLRKYDRIFFEL